MTAAEALRSDTEPTLARCTVLVIEDHPDSRHLLVNVLRALRAHVVVAKNIEEAELQLALVRVNLIICDMYLPDGTGLDFMRWLRAQAQTLADTPCIAVTGYDKYFPADRATGFDAYLRKPIDLNKFCDVAIALARR